MNDPKYVLDTCSLTKMRHTYPHDVFPSAWAKLTELANNGIIVSAADVWEELNNFEDEISLWCKNQSNFFIPLSENIQIHATHILSTHPGLLDIKRNKSSADPFVIGTALELECTVVTEEKRNNSTVHPNIPNVCDDLEVECINILEMFRKEGLKS